MKAEAIAKKIKLVCLDVDGVLTDGSIFRTRRALQAVLRQRRTRN